MSINKLYLCSIEREKIVEMNRFFITFFHYSISISIYKLINTSDLIFLLHKTFIQLNRNPN